MQNLKTKANKMSAVRVVAIGAVLSLMALSGFGWNFPSAHAANLPDPAQDTALAAPGAAPQTIVLSGGCFWGVQAVFQHVKGVKSAVSGYAGGAASTAQYETVSTGTTGHAESVQVTYDPSQVTLGKILKVFFEVAHDPTELNHQGADHGTQYRSAVFFTTPEQDKIVTAYIGQLGASDAFKSPIVTKVGPLEGFYKAEDYHQDYARLHPDNPYIAYNDLPKVRNLEASFPDLYVKD